MSLDLKERERINSDFTILVLAVTVNGRQGFEACLITTKMTFNVLG
jgi:hypothetical protein